MQGHRHTHTLKHSKIISAHIDTFGRNVNLCIHRVTHTFTQPISSLRKGVLTKDPFTHTHTHRDTATHMPMTSQIDKCCKLLYMLKYSVKHMGWTFRNLFTNVCSIRILWGGGGYVSYVYTNCICYLNTQSLPYHCSYHLPVSQYKINKWAYELNLKKGPLDNRTNLDMEADIRHVNTILLSSFHR